MSENQETEIKNDIIQALSHAEASDGLYLDNLQVVHEEEERPQVRGTQFEILEALKSLIEEGIVQTDETGEKVVFFLAERGRKGTEE